MSRGTTGPLEFYPHGMYPQGTYTQVMYPQGMYPHGMYPPPSSLRSPVKKTKQYSGVVRRIPYSKHVQPNKKYEPIVKWENELNIYDNEWKPTQCQNSEIFCQLFGKHKMVLPNVNSVDIYVHMNEKCDSMAPEYLRNKGC